MKKPVKETADTNTEQNTQRNNDKHQQETRNSLNSLIGYSNVPTLGWDSHQRINIYNAAIGRMTGYTLKEILGQPLSMLFPETVRETSMDRIKHALEVKDGETLELTILHKDGSIRTALWSPANIYAENGTTLIATIAQGMDITERKHTEESLRESEEKYRLIIEHSPLGLLSFDDKGCIVACNDNFVKIIGSSREKLIGLNMLNLPDKNIVSAVQQALNGQSGYYEGNYASTTAKKVTPARVLFEPINIEGRGISGGVGIIEDITERKQAEEALRISEDRFKQVAENAQEWIWEVDASGLYTYSSPMLKSILGYEASEVIGKKHFYDFIHPEDREEIKNAALAAFNQKQAFHEFVNRNVRKDGETVFLSTSGVPILDRDGNLCGYRGADVDITERMGAEEAIRESESRYSAIFQGAAEGILIADVETKKFIYANDSICRMLGYSEEELTRLGVHDIHPEESLNDVLSEFEIQARGKKPTVSGLPCKRKDGSIFYANISASGMILNNKKCSVGFFSDVTDRRRAEDALRESESRYRGLVDLAVDGILLGSHEGIITEANECMCAIVGMAREEFIGKHISFLPFTQESIKKSPLRFDLLQQGETVVSERMLIRPDQSTIVVEMRTKMMPDGTYQSIYRDISERKRAEETLRESEEKYRAVIESSPVGIFIIKDGLVQYVNPVMHEITGYTEQDVIGKHFLNFVAKKYQETEKDFYARRIKGEIFPTSYETGAIIKNGTEIPVELTVSIFTLLGEKAELVFVRDITERKEAERILLQNKQELDSIYNTVGDMVFQLQVEEGDRFRFNNVNRTYENYTGLNASMVIGKLVSEIISEPLLSINIKKYHQAIKQKTIVRWEETSQFPAGMLAYEASVAPVFDMEGNCTHIVGSFHDITERKMVEDRIKKLNEELEDRVKTRTKQIEEVNKELEAFAYSVSHDLRAPLRAISGFTRILTEDYATKFDAEGQRVCGVIQDEAVRMGVLIDDLLSFSRLSRSSMQTSVINMKQLIQQVYSELIRQTKPKEIEFILNDLPEAEGDYNLLQQVWINLLSNAIKYTSKKEQPRIEVGYTTEASETIFYIKDNGAGFDMKYAGKLFGVFQRLHSQEEFDGTGVGLAIVQRIIFRHNGRVWAEGIIDQGATFYFSLPTKK